MLGHALQMKRGLSTEDVATKERTYSLRPKNKCRSRFLRSQTILILTKYIQENINIYSTYIISIIR